jgi:hypothetical protein
MVGADGVVAGEDGVGAGEDGGLTGDVVCPERNEANRKNAAARKNKGESPRGEVRIQGYRMTMENRLALAIRWCVDANLGISMDNGGAGCERTASDPAYTAEYVGKLRARKMRLEIG